MGVSTGTTTHTITIRQHMGVSTGTTTHIITKVYTWACLPEQLLTLLQKATHGRVYRNYNIHDYNEAIPTISYETVENNVVCTRK